jgi:hypothetical protein
MDQESEGTSVVIFVVGGVVLLLVLLMAGGAAFFFLAADSGPMPAEMPVMEKHEAIRHEVGPMDKGRENQPQVEKVPQDPKDEKQVPPMQK